MNLDTHNRLAMYCFAHSFDDAKEEREVSGAKNATAHFVWRCGFCKRESSAKFERSRPMPYSSENGDFQDLVVIECRGLEFTGFDPRVRAQLCELTTASAEDFNVSPCAPLCLWHIGNMES